jgi:hypothetical protein
MFTTLRTLNTLERRNILKPEIVHSPIPIPITMNMLHISQMKQTEEIIWKNVEHHMAKYEKPPNPKKFKSTSGPLSFEMYQLTMYDPKIPSSLDTFKWSED